MRSCLRPGSLHDRTLSARGGGRLGSMTSRRQPTTFGLHLAARSLAPSSLFQPVPTLYTSILPTLVSSPDMNKLKQVRLAASVLPHARAPPRSGRGRFCFVCR